MNSAAAVADVIEAFKQRGFEFVGKTDDGWFRLHGRLMPPQADKGWPCEVHLDPTFFDLPRIRLLEIPHELPAAVPHFGADGGLCYLAKGTVVLDIYDPVGQSLACLQRAAVVFGQIMKGEMIEDLAEEFFAYWCVFHPNSATHNDRNPPPVTTPSRPPIPPAKPPPIPIKKPARSAGSEFRYKNRRSCAERCAPSPQPAHRLPLEFHPMRSAH
ncbi:hypothetical protein GCM10007933_15980 [Zoogloea oryzae]|uniref:Prokaryotic E2 family B domain-containing protein n=1 Tax=Zoogloea oryzae TaxID=310767 RepID=A0ABQ6FBN3_9RHOO|nr:E2/UBC family protein [Zoogloea oryzae]GLT22140.1 hypothetical protein GCM10007933_15980 [Zoogloea oryzae]